MKNKYFRSKLGVVMISIFIAGILSWSFISFLISPFYKKTRGKGYYEIAALDSLSEELPARLYFQMVNEDAYLKSEVANDVWVIKHHDDSVTVFSPICTHLGCRYNWNAGDKNFVCPCHASIFTIDGKVIAGPAPRALDTLPHVIKDEKLYVKWQRYRAGIPQKIAIES